MTASVTFAPLRALQSLHSGAQARTIRELIVGAHPRPPLMEPLLVPLFLTLYLGFKPHFTLLCRKLGTTGTSAPFRFFAFAHNLLLCFFSATTAAAVVPLTLRHLREYGTRQTYCTRSLWLHGMHYWGYLFYLSKYWELLDTAVLICKGRPPSFLQVYHHAVTIACAYMLQASQASVTFVFVGLNACVHTVMYAYYAMTILGARGKGKAAITAMQMVQFVVGIAASLPMFWMGSKCATRAQKVGVALFITHATVLLKLFADFYVQSYREKRKKA